MLVRGPALGGYLIGTGTMTMSDSPEQAPAKPRAGARGAVVLAMPLTRTEAAEFDAMGVREFDCYPVFSSLVDVIRHYLLLRLVGARAGFDSPEYDGLEGACLASGCACPVDSKRDGQTWRLCAAAGEPCRSVGRPVEAEPRRRAPAKPAPAWAGGRGAVTLTMPLTRAEADEFERMAREWDGAGYPSHADLADVVRHAALVAAVRDREAGGDEEEGDEEEGDEEEGDEEEGAGDAPDPGFTDPDSEAFAVLNACPASGCSCPGNKPDGGLVWRECAAVGTFRRSAGRPVWFR